MASQETTLSVEGEFWGILDRIAKYTRKSKRAILWQMLTHFLEDEEARRYLRFEGMSGEELSTIRDLLKESSVLMVS